MKRIFKDLFERQGFEDDGIFDWDILKKQKEQGTSFVPGTNTNEDNEVDNEGNVIDKKNIGEVEGNIPASGTTSPRAQTTAAGGRPSIAGSFGNTLLHKILNF